MRFTQNERNRAEKKIQIAIDKMIDLQDLGFGCEDIERILDRLRTLEIDVCTKDYGQFKESVL